jgi:hypothetical protein
MKWKIRLARDMGQEAFVVIEAPTSEDAEAILWHDTDPDVIRWSDDDVMGDREVREVYPADDKDELTPARNAAGSHAQSPEDVSRHLGGRGRGGHAAQRSEKSPVLPDATGHAGLRSFRGLPVRR